MDFTWGFVGYWVEYALNWKLSLYEGLYAWLLDLGNTRREEYRRSDG